ncbi:MAG: N-acyl homoserine lactonase family protein [Bacteroidia bacterium]|nr:N-acyl homoserine lactonase family protein [Bacteroidia bacterium]
MYTLTLAPDIRIHAFQTGTVSIKQEHYRYSGLGLLRIPMILWGRTWTPDFPIWVWALETPQGTFLIDTGETPAFFDPDHFGTNTADAFVNRSILTLKVSEADRIDNQLRQAGILPANIDAVLMTHLHIDHTDGLCFFPHSEVIISRTDWERPYGAPVSSFPAGLKPRLITYPDDTPLGPGCRIAEGLFVVPTPGHTLGHQSVVFQHGDELFMFAGDSAFSEAQMLRGEVGGISLSPRMARDTQARLRMWSREHRLIYLPSHDPDSATRLMQRQTTRS